MIQGILTDPPIIQYEYKSDKGELFYSSKSEMTQEDINKTAAYIHRIDEIANAHFLIRKRVRRHLERKRIKRKHQST